MDLFCLEGSGKSKVFGARKTKHTRVLTLRSFGLAKNSSLQMLCETITNNRHSEGPYDSNCAAGLGGGSVLKRVINCWERGGPYKRGSNIN